MTWIKEIVEGLIEVYETRDIYELVKLLDILLIRRDLPRGKKGRFFRDIYGNETIFLSSKINPVEERQVIAHELGHAILHIELSTSDYSENQLINKDRLELEANEFAAELLIPDDIDFSEYDSMTIKELSCLLGVSEELVSLKFKR